jgi:hypothetical protein
MFYGDWWLININYTSASVGGSEFLGMLPVVLDITSV